MNHKLTCAVCGGTFYSQRRNTPVCSETCRRQYKKMKKAEMVKSNTSATPTKKRKSHIEEINAAARAAGMTYGKYVAMKVADMITISFTKWARL